MFMRVQLTTAEPEETMLVPERSLGINQSRKYVAVVDEKNRVEYRTVTTGRSIPSRDGMLRVVQDGLDGNERIVVSGMSRAREGSIVKPLEDSMIRQTPQEMTSP
jgi:multidrug efflux system membrane fusion protein